MAKAKKRSDRSKPSGDVPAQKIAARRSAKRTVREGVNLNEERLQQLAGIARQWIWEVDRDGLYTYSNSVVKDILGYEPHEIVGKKHFYDLFLDHMRDKIKRTVLEAFDCRASIVDFVNPCVHKNGNVVHLLTNGLPVIGKDGQLAGYRGMDVDITTRKKAEEDLRKTNQQLAETLTRLKLVQDQVVQHERLGALWQMADGITHKFNNALTPILGHADLLLSQPEILDDKEDAISMLMEIRKAGLQARDAVRQLHEFCRASDGSVFEALDVDVLLEDAIRLSQPRWKGEFETKGADIKFKKEFRNLLPVRGNRSQLSEVFVNLLLNSIDAMPKGGTITVYAHPDESMHMLIVGVRDTGTGMTGDVRRRALEPFFTTRGVQRSGLGLSMAHGIVRRHKGILDIESCPDGGTAILVRLPLALEPVVPVVGQRAERLVSKKPLHILFIDDEKPVRDLIARYLEVEHHLVEVAESGDQGLRRFQEAKHDLVITDWAMPGMNGDRVAAAIKAFDQHTPVILLTGFGDTFNQTAKLPPGVDLVISKPVTRSVFKEAIEKVMSRKAV